MLNDPALTFDRIIEVETHYPHPQEYRRDVNVNVVGTETIETKLHDITMPIAGQLPIILAYDSSLSTEGGPNTTAHESLGSDIFSTQPSEPPSSLTGAARLKDSAPTRGLSADGHTTSGSWSHEAQRSL